jgi:phosphoserine phosphatase
MKMKLAVFDMDGTLLEEKSSWVTLHQHFNTIDAGRRGFELYKEGKISYREFMRLDITAWPNGLRISEIESALSKYTIKREAKSTLDRLRKEGFEVAIITAGLDLLAKKVANDLRIKIWIANGLKIDDQGRLTGEGECRVDPLRKVIPFRRLLMQLKAKKEESIAVGDSVFDLNILKGAGKGFLIANEESVNDPEVIKIERLHEIFLYL